MKVLRLSYDTTQGTVHAVFWCAWFGSAWHYPQAALSHFMRWDTASPVHGLGGTNAKCEAQA